MAWMNGAQAVVKVLTDQGVDRVFGLPEARSFLFTMRCGQAVSPIRWCGMKPPQPMQLPDTPGLPGR